MLFKNGWRLALALCAMASPALAVDDHVLLTEAVSTPTDGEYIEIANPTAGPIDLTNTYLSDDEDYALLPSVDPLNLPNIGSSDFICQFPAGTMIPGGAVFTIAFDGAGFIANYGIAPDFEILGTDPTVPDMIATDVGSSAGLTNGGECAILFSWDGASDLVQDIDLVNLGTPSGTNDIPNKTGVMVDGPDADLVASTYNAELGTMPIMAGDAGFGFSNKRLLLEGANEMAGGNGLTGDDETSENILLTWDSVYTAPTPGAAEIFGPAAIGIGAGIDLWATADGTAAVEFGAAGGPPAIPAGFFSAGSDAFNGVVNLGGLPLTQFGGDSVGTTDTIVRRTSSASLLPAPSMDTVDVEIVALSLASTAPIMVNDGGVITEWDVRVTISDCTASTGTMSISRECEDGGSWSSSVNLAPKFIFTRTDGTPGELILDAGCSATVLDLNASSFWTFQSFDPSFGYLTVSGGVDVDGNLDGVADGGLPGSTPNFNSGVELSECELTTPSGTATQDAVLTCFDAPGFGHCANPPVEIVPACPEITGLSFVSNCDISEITVNWVNALTYDSIEVRRDGALVATLGGSLETFTDGTVGPGVYVYEVTGFCGSASTAISGTINHCPDVRINEIRIDQPSADDDEYAELDGAPGVSLEGLTYVVIGDGSGGSGTIESVTALSGAVNPSGLFVIAEGTFTLGTADLTASLSFENSDNVTHLLVSGFTGSNGDDLDADDDGVLDAEPWATVIDCVALVENLADGELVYCDTQVGPVGSFVPGHVLRCGDDWGIGIFDPSSGIDSPGVDNVCPDCDTNGQPDPVEIANGTTDDCNANAIPDSCDFADGTALDCNSNGIPDSCDIFDGTSLDCNDNDIPDECDLAAGTELDCNANGIPDSCEIADGTALDCNENGIPDSCDLASGAAQDCNANGIPDSCDIADGTSLDADLNGIPDECSAGPQFDRGDCNADGGFDIGDPIFLLAELFSGGPAGSCADACDSNDDGGKDIGDAVFSLSTLFSGGPNPPAPFGTCGEDPTDDSLDCADFPSCP